MAIYLKISPRGIREKIGIIDIMTRLLQMFNEEIKHGRVRPSLSREESERLLEEKILGPYAKGRYSGSSPVTIGAMADIMNNRIFTLLLVNMDYLKRNGNVAGEARREITEENKQFIYELGIFGDWLFHHPQVIRYALATAHAKT